jgi:hypothetical protein
MSLLKSLIFLSVSLMFNSAMASKNEKSKNEAEERYFESKKTEILQPIVEDLLNQAEEDARKLLLKVEQWNKRDQKLFPLTPEESFQLSEDAYSSLLASSQILLNPTFEKFVDSHLWRYGKNITFLEENKEVADFFRREWNDYQASHRNIQKESLINYQHIRAYNKLREDYQSGRINFQEADLDSLSKIGKIWNYYEIAKKFIMQAMWPSSAELWQKYEFRTKLDSLLIKNPPSGN